MPESVRSKPILLLAAVLVAALARALLGSARPASADTCSAGCTVEVTFEDATFWKSDDCSFEEPCAPYQVSQAYGRFSATTWKAGVFGPIEKLKLAAWGGQPGFCPSGGVQWQDSLVGRAECFRIVGEAEGWSYGCTTCTTPRSCGLTRSACHNRCPGI